KGLNLSGSVKVNGGSGDNTVLLSGGDTLGSLSITNADGFDTLLIGLSSAAVQRSYKILGALTVSNGSGDSATRLGRNGVDSVSLGSAKITNGNGFDVMTAIGANLT